jgi:transposase
MSGAARLSDGGDQPAGLSSSTGGDRVIVRLGVDIACRAPHQASLATEDGRLLWTGRRFRTNPFELDRLWSRLPATRSNEPVQVMVVMSPPTNAWVPLAAWFRRRGATVVLVPPERAADLRAYYAKHTKSDRLDSTVLARLPLLHPEGLHPEHGLGPGDPLRRATKLHSTLTHRRSTALARLDALLEILGPAWHAALSADLANKTPLKLLAAGYADPHVLRRIGTARLARFLYRHSRGAWGEAKAEQLLAAAADTLQLFDGELDDPELADDIALEARLALALTAEITELDERIALPVHRADPHGVISSAPGVSPITSAVILGRLGNPSRFASLAAAHSYTGLVPSLHASGLTGQHGGPTKRGDALLREALFMAANQARRLDPTLAAKYHRLIAHPGKHHTSAVCHIAATLSPASWPAGAPASAISFVTPTAPALTYDQARAIIAQRYPIPEDLRAIRRRVHRDLSVVK